jgi:hypothetical protein
VKIWVSIVGLIDLPPSHHVFLVSIFFNFAMFVGKKMEKQ